MVYRIGEHEGRTVDIQILSRSAPRDRAIDAVLAAREIRSPACRDELTDRQSDAGSDDCPKRGRLP
jgi:hypothetical protein